MAFRSSYRPKLWPVGHWLSRKCVGYTPMTAVDRIKRSPNYFQPPLGPEPQGNPHDAPWRNYPRNLSKWTGYRPGACGQRRRMRDATRRERTRMYAENYGERVHEIVEEYLGGNHLYTPLYALSPSPAQDLEQ